MARSHAAVSIRRHLQATSLLAVLAGYVLLLLVNRQLGAQLRQQRQAAQLAASADALERLPPAQLDSPVALQRQLAEFASPVSLAWMLWLQPEAPAGAVPLLPSGAAFAALQQRPGLLRAAAAAARPAGGVPVQFVFSGGTYMAASAPLRLAGRSYVLHVLQDVSLETEQEEIGRAHV